MVGSAALKQGRSANLKHTYFFLPKCGEDTAKRGGWRPCIK